MRALQEKFGGDRQRARYLLPAGFEADAIESDDEFVMDVDSIPVSVPKHAVQEITTKKRGPHSR
jgi:hypothetical protein